MDKPNVLIVDDEMGPREALRMILKDHFQVSLATNGAEAVQHIKEHAVPLVIMDMKMPVMDGLNALKLIKEHNAFISVLMVTGYGTIDTAVEAMKVGALDYITKPFDTFSILGKAQNALEEYNRKVEAQNMLLRIQEASQRLSDQQDSLQKQLIQLSKLSTIGTLAQGIAHNLSSPLLIILGRAELMKEKLLQLRSQLLAFSNDVGTSGGKGLSKILSEYDYSIKDTEIIIDNVIKLTDIIRNMMQKSRQDQIQESQLINLSDVLTQELKFLEADLFFKHNIEKIYSLSKDVPAIKGVYSDFSQTFLNIIQNALDAMRDSPVKRLTVEVSADQGFIDVRIRDTGCGIPPESLERIFEPYFSTKKDTGAEGRFLGTGLGLHMVQLLMQPYDVRISVQSRPGDTCFALRIPYD
jgi:signal transduction histidine kinase